MSFFPTGACVRAMTLAPKADKTTSVIASPTKTPTQRPIWSSISMRLKQCVMAHCTVPMQVPETMGLHSRPSAIIEPIVQITTMAIIASRAHLCVEGTRRSEPMFLTVRLATNSAAEHLIIPRARA